MKHNVGMTTAAFVACLVVGMFVGSFIVPFATARTVKPSTVDGDYTVQLRSSSGSLIVKSVAATEVATIDASGRAQFKACSVGSAATAPFAGLTTPTGTCYVNTGTSKLTVWTGSAWAAVH